MKFKLPSHPWILKIAHVSLVLWHDVRRCDLFKHASAMAYALILSIIPTLAAVFSLISLFKPLLGKEGSIFTDLEAFIVHHLATGSGEQAVQYMEKFLGNLDITKIGLTGFAGLIISLALFLNQIEEALNRIWLIPKARSPVTRFIYFWTFLTLGAFLSALAVGVVSGFSLNNLMPSFGHEAVKQGSGLVKLLMPFGATFLFFFLLYKVVPNCHVPLKDAALGSLVATVMVQVATSGYSFYIAKFTKYQAVYGALAAVPMFLFWLYLNALIILFGALVSWRFEQGFYTEGAMVGESKHQTPTDRLRNTHLQSVMPLAVLLILYKKFQLGDGKGFSGRELAERMFVPAAWIFDALQVLEQLGYIHSVAPATAEEGESFLARSFIPALPDSAIQIEKLIKDFTEGCKNWLREWQPDLPAEILSVLKGTFSTEFQILRRESLHKLLAK